MDLTDITYFIQQKQNKHFSHAHKKHFRNQQQKGNWKIHKYIQIKWPMSQEEIKKDIKYIETKMETPHTKTYGMQQNQF